jgi:hypothetical protein
MFIFTEYLGVSDVVENTQRPCVEAVLSPSTNDRTKKDAAGAILVLRRGTLFKVSQA